uniref:Lin-15A/B-like domain-containing protein n=1 Tax=Caenorhabditis japonica TaxID=281687 RepID=A0A8R1DSD4_CAEJA
MEPGPSNRQDTLPEDHGARTTDLLARFIVSQGIPYESVKDGPLQDLIQHLKPKYQMPPNEAIMRNAVKIDRRDRLTLQYIKQMSVTFDVTEKADGKKFLVFSVHVMPNTNHRKQIVYLRSLENTVIDELMIHDTIRDAVNNDRIIITNVICPNEEFEAIFQTNCISRHKFVCFNYHVGRFANSILRIEDCVEKLEKLRDFVKEIKADRHLLYEFQRIDAELIIQTIRHSVYKDQHTYPKIANIVIPNEQKAQLFNVKNHVTKHFICFNHIITIFVDNVLKIEEFSERLEQLRKFVRLLRNNRDIYNDFKRTQLARNSDYDLPPTNPKAPWRTTAAFLQKCIYHYEIFVQIAKRHNLPNNFSHEAFLQLIFFDRILQQCLKYVKYLSGPFSSISQVIPAITSLKNYISSNSMGYPFEKQIRSTFVSVFEKVVSGDLGKYYEMATLLDPRFGYQMDLYSEAIWMEIESKVINEFVSKNDTEETLDETAKEKRKSVITREMQDYKIHCLGNRLRENENPINWWVTRQTLMSKLAIMAREFFVCPPVAIDANNFFGKTGKFSRLCETYQAKQLENCLMVAGYQQEFRGIGARFDATYKYEPSVEFTRLLDDSKEGISVKRARLDATVNNSSLGQEQKPSTIDDNNFETEKKPNIVEDKIIKIENESEHEDEDGWAGFVDKYVPTTSADVPSIRGEDVEKVCHSNPKSSRPRPPRKRNCAICGKKEKGMYIKDVTVIIERLVVTLAAVHRREINMDGARALFAKNRITVCRIHFVESCVAILQILKINRYESIANLPDDAFVGMMPSVEAISGRQFKPTELRNILTLFAVNYNELATARIDPVNDKTTCVACGEQGNTSEMVRSPENAYEWAQWMNSLGIQFFDLHDSLNDSFLCREHFPPNAFGKTGRLLTGMLPVMDKFDLTNEAEVDSVDNFEELTEISRKRHRCSKWDAEEAEETKDSSDHLLAKFFVSQGIPYEAVNHHAFRTLFKDLRPDYTPPTSEILKSKVGALSWKRSNLFIGIAEISVTFDVVGMENDDDEKFLVFSAHFFDDERKCRRNHVFLSMLGNCQIDDKTIMNCILSTINPDGTQQFCRIKNLVSPNRKIAQLFSTADGSMTKNFICFNHYISLFVDDILQIEEFAKALSMIRKYVRQIRDDSKLLVKFKRMQASMNNDILLPVIPRGNWQSVATFLAQFIASYESLIRFSGRYQLRIRISDMIFQQLVCLHKILELCRQQTENLGSPFSSISQVIPAVVSMKKFIFNLSGYYPFVATIRRMFANVFQNVTTGEVKLQYDMATLLDPRFGYRDDLYSELIWLDIERKLINGHAESSSSDGTDQIDDRKLLMSQVRAYRRYCWEGRPAETESPLDWWDVRGEELARLSPIARQFFSCPPASTDAEYFFGNRGKFSHLCQKYSGFELDDYLTVAGGEQEFQGKCSKSDGSEISKTPQELYPWNAVGTSSDIPNGFIDSSNETPSISERRHCALCGKLVASRFTKTVRNDVNRLFIALGAVYQDELEPDEAQQLFNTDRIEICRVHFVKSCDAFFERLQISGFNELSELNVSDFSENVQIISDIFRIRLNATNVHNYMSAFTEKYYNFPEERRARARPDEYDAGRTIDWLAKFMVTHGMAYESVREPTFQNLLRHLNPDISIPAPAEIEEVIGKMSGRIDQIISPGQKEVSVTFDVFGDEDDDDKYLVFSVHFFLDVEVRKNMVYLAKMEHNQ